MSQPTVDSPRSAFAATMRRDAIAALGAGLTAGLLLAWALVSRKPLVGFDFQYFLPRLLDVRLHQLQEGWFAIQWWTPSFGGGLPAFANPQHTQFMLAQFLVPLVGPWGAAVTQAAVFNAIGVSLVCWICRRRFGCSLTASLLAAATFGTSGFMWEHALAGHLGFNVFPLVALVPEALHAAVPAARAIAILGLTGAFIVLGGGYTVILIFALTCLLLALLLPLAQPATYRLKDIIARLCFGAVAAAMAAAAKVVAAALFLGRFPRLADYQFGGAPGAELLSILWQTFGRRGTMLLSRWLPLSGTEWSGFLGRGEDVGYGPAAVLILLGGTVVLWQTSRLRCSWRQRPKLWVGVIAAIFLVTECTLGRGLIWPVLKPLPFLRSLRENHRLAAAFALPFALAIAPCWDALRRLGPSARPFAWAATLLAFAGTVWSVEYFFRNRGSFWYGSYDATIINQTWNEIRTEPIERFRITQIAEVHDDHVFRERASSLRPYEPIFGYGYGGPRLPRLHAAGPIEQSPAPAPHWTFNDPRSFLSGSAGPPVQSLAATEETALRALLDHRQPAWDVPAEMQLAWGISIVAAAGLLAGLFLPAGSWGRAQLRPAPVAPVRT